MSVPQQRIEEPAALAAPDLLRIVTDEIPVMLTLIDSDGRVTYVNRRALDFTGRTLEDFLSRGWEREIHPDDRSWLVDAEELYHRQRQDHVVEYRTRRHDGEYRWLRDVTVARFGPDGVFLGFIEVSEDVTEARAAREDLARQREALHQSEKLASLGSLLAGVAHELNNPLSIVVSHAQLLEETAPDARTAARAGKIHAAATRCGRIVASFLAMARRRPPTQGLVDLNRIVEATLDLVGYRLRSSGTVVELDLERDLPGSWADGDQLQQLVTNLVVNAEQAMAECEAARHLSLATRFEPSTGRLRLEVADSGPGVPPEIRARIFEPFFTTKPLGTGTGVGLSLCHGIVTSHGGTITVGDAAGGGALFVVTLPCAPAGTPEMRPQADPAQEAVPQAILVVDDEAEIAEALAEILGAAGHQVETVPDGRAALKRIAERRFALIVSDLRMPNVDGPSLYRALTKCDPHWETRVIFTTGDTLSPATASFLDLTGRPCIEKPFEAGAVRHIVAEALAAASEPAQSPSGTKM